VSPAASHAVKDTGDPLRRTQAAGIRARGVRVERERGGGWRVREVEGERGGG